MAEPRLRNKGWSYAIVLLCWEYPLLSLAFQVLSPSLAQDAIPPRPQIADITSILTVENEWGCYYFHT